jgi:ribonuclease R
VRSPKQRKSPRRHANPSTERKTRTRRDRDRAPATESKLPAIGLLAITDIDLDGEMHGRPLAWPEDAPAPDLRVVAEKGAPALAIGDRAVARFARGEDGDWEARIIRAVAPAPERVLGIYRPDQEGGRIEPTDRKVRTEFRVAASNSGGARAGEVVLADILEQRRFGLPEAKIVERLGDSADPRSFSLIAIHAHGIPTQFPPEALALAAEARPVPLGQREDLRKVPLVTIDGADARDFDDAVWAEPDPENEGGFHAIVAIADVSWYVRPGDALDRAAHERGNSVYFPDRVVPMLPEELSNELCSLKPQVDRAAVAVHLQIGADGQLVRHRFVRGLMRSAARLTYEEAQAAIEGRPSDQARALVKPVLEPLYAIYRALAEAREKRGTLDLDLPERSILLDEAGHVARIEPHRRLDSHRLIEELMIAANVAAAETLERLKQPCMYRVHDAPDPAKLVALREFLDSIGIAGLRLAKGQVVRPHHFTQILKKAQGTPYVTLVNQLVLRSQAQAVYSPKNIGHFGLALRRYAHFTSPIRRYADLLVHRALVTGHRWGEGGLEPVDAGAFAHIGEQVSMTERRASAAERSASDRYLAAFLADRVGGTFPGRVSGVTRAGLFVTLDETGADGLMPMRSLPGDYYVHDEAHHRLVGRRTRRAFTLGDRLTVRLAEANSVTGSLLFALDDDDAPRKPHKPRR